MNATVGATLEYTTNNDKNKTVQNIKGILTIVEGTLTFTPYQLPKEGLDAAAKAITIVNFIIDDDVHNLKIIYRLIKKNNKKRIMKKRQTSCVVKLKLYGKRNKR